MPHEISISFTTPYRVDIECVGRTATLLGESFARGYGSPDFIIFANQPICWNTPLGREHIEEAERVAIQTQVLGLLRKQGWLVELE
jgi:hypothetical protein